MHLFPNTTTFERERYQAAAAAVTRRREAAEQAEAAFRAAQQAEGGFRYAHPYSPALQRVHDVYARECGAYHAALRTAEQAAYAARSEWIQAGAEAADSATIIPAGNWVRLDGYGTRMLLPPGLWALWEHVTANPGGGSRVVVLGQATLPLPVGALTVMAAPMAPPHDFPALPRTTGMVDRIWVTQAEQPSNLNGAFLVRSDLWRWVSPGNGPDYNSGRGRIHRVQGDRSVADDLGVTAE